MSNADRIAHKAQDCIDALESIRDRARRAEADTRPPSRGRSELGTRTTGNTSSDPESTRTWTDPVGDSAIGILDTLSRVDVQLMGVKEGLYKVARQLQDWAPAKQWDNGIRRCGTGGCASKHYALGLCKTHYTRAKRAEEREAADRARQQEKP